MCEDFMELRRGADGFTYYLGEQPVSRGRWLELWWGDHVVSGYFDRPTWQPFSVDFVAFLQAADATYGLAETSRLRLAAPPVAPPQQEEKLWQEAKNLQWRLQDLLERTWQPLMRRPELRAQERLTELLQRATARVARRHCRWQDPDAPPRPRTAWVPLRQTLEEWRADGPVRYYVAAQAELALWRGFTLLAVWSEDSLWTCWYWPTNGHTNPCTGTPAQAALAAEYGIDPYSVFQYARDFIDAQWDASEQRGRFWHVPSPSARAAGEGA